MQKNQAKLLHSTLADAGYKEGNILVVGVSGGPDSLALLHQLSSSLGSGVLHVAHLDHRIRPSSSTDAKVVADLALSWDIPFSGKQVDVPDLASRQGWSLEEAARKARYEFLAEVAQATGASLVAVGHNSDDQAETILLHFLRGSGLSGLRGMQVLSPYPGDPDLKLLRPLLHQSRSEIEAYCQKHALDPLVDETNTDPTYLRNRIRLQLLPDLAVYNPQIKNQLLQLAEIATAEDDVVSALFNNLWPELIVQIGPGWLHLDRQGFCGLPTALQRRAIRKAVETLYLDVSDLAYKTVNQALDLANRKESGIETMLPHGLTMLVDYQTLLFARNLAEIPGNLPQVLADGALPLLVPGQVKLANEWMISSQLIERKPGETKAESDPWSCVIDLPDQDLLYVRARRSGERMQPLGMDGHSSSLQDIMVNRKLSARLREKWPLVATDDHVVWLTGHIIDQRVRVTDNSRRIVRLACERIGEKS